MFFYFYDGIKLLKQRRLFEWAYFVAKYTRPTLNWFNTNAFKGTAIIVKCAGLLYIFFIEAIDLIDGEFC